MWLASTIPHPIHQPFSQPATPNNVQSNIYPKETHSFQTLSQPESDANHTFLDLCFHLSPDVFVEGSTVFVKLHTVLQNWNISEVLTNPTNNKHPLLQHLQVLHDFKKGANKRIPFVLAPSPSLAAWALKEEKTKAQALTHHPTKQAPNILKIYNSMELQKAFQKAPPESLIQLIADQIPKRPYLRKHWKLFLQDLKYLGIRNVLELKEVFQVHSLKLQCHKKFPEITSLIYQRLILGHQDFSLKSFTPQMLLHSHVSLTTQSAQALLSRENILDHIKDTLNHWQLRLEARQSTLQGIELRLEFLLLPNSLETYVHPLEIDFNKSLNRSFDIVSAIHEELSKLPPSVLQLFKKPLQKIELSSKGLSKTNTHQMKLFDQNRIQFKKGHIQHEQTQTIPDSSTSFIDQFRGPLLCFPEAESLSLGLRSFDEFILFLRQENSLHNIRNIGRRFYAQVGDQWIFWDESVKSCFLQGYFKETSSPQSRVAS